MAASWRTHRTIDTVHEPRRHRGTERTMFTNSIRSFVVIAGVLAVSSAVHLPLVAQTGSTPDFSGVYRPINAFGPAPAGGRAAAPAAPRPAPGQPLPPPTRTAPLSDGSRGRAADA